MIKYISVISLCSSLSLLANENYNSTNLSKNLTDNADAVIRLDEVIFTIEDTGKATKQIHKVVTILNERGEDNYSVFKAFYDKQSRIKKIEIAIYNASGTIIKKIKNNEIKDIGISAFGNSVEDERVKVATIDKKKYNYPYTVEYSYVMETNNMMFYPIWQPYGEKNTSLEKAIFSVICTTGFSFRYKELNISKPVTITKQKENIVHTWELDNLPAYKSEPYSPPNIWPYIITAPTFFSVAKHYRGNINSWSDIGKFYYTINQNRDALPLNIKQKIKELTANITTPIEKIRKLYEYMQANTHYMSIQLGIGGWQTMEAKEVAEKGYGDCKALTNYINALLKEVGVTAYPALVYAGNDATEIHEDFPSFHFNHVISVIPMEQDTIWLECTSQTNSLGYQGGFTGNRKALMILPYGGKLVNTTYYKSSDNLQRRNASINIQEDGIAQASIKTTYAGIQQDSRNIVINTMDDEDKKKWILKTISIPSFDLEKFSLKENKSNVPQINEHLQIKINKAFTQNGNHVFITLNILTPFLNTPEKGDERKTDLYLNINDYNFQDIDTIKYHLPANLTIEHLPENVHFKSKFGEYSYSITSSNNELTYCRNVIVTGGYFSRSDYQEWADFVKKINKHDKTNIIFKKK